MFCCLFNIWYLCRRYLVHVAPHGTWAAAFVQPFSTALHLCRSAQCFDTKMDRETNVQRRWDINMCWGTARGVWDAVNGSVNLLAASRIIKKKYMHSGAAVGWCNKARQSITLETEAKTLQIIRGSASVGRQRDEQRKRFMSFAVGLPCWNGVGHRTVRRFRLTCWLYLWSGWNRFRGLVNWCGASVFIT